MSSYPTFEAELGSAMARGSLSQTMADVSILACYKSLDEARQKAMEVRRAARIHLHIANQLRIRIRDVAREHIRSKAPKNIILAACHDINRSQYLQEEEVTAIVVEEVYASLPDAPGRRHGR